MTRISMDKRIALQTTTNYLEAIKMLCPDIITNQDELWTETQKNAKREFPPFSLFLHVLKIGSGCNYRRMHQYRYFNQICN